MRRQAVLPPLPLRSGVLSYSRGSRLRGQRRPGILHQLLRSTLLDDVNAQCVTCSSRYHVGMKEQAPDVQYTIRGVPPEVDRALRKKAARRKLSLNQMIIEELTAVTTGVRKRADFHDIAGQWTPDPAFDEIIASQRQIDPDKWK